MNSAFWKEFIGFNQLKDRIKEKGIIYFLPYIFGIIAISERITLSDIGGMYLAPLGVFSGIYSLLFYKPRRISMIFVTFISGILVILYLLVPLISTDISPSMGEQLFHNYLNYIIFTGILSILIYGVIRKRGVHNKII